MRVPMTIEVDRVCPPAERWIADVVGVPGAIAFGQTPIEAIQNVLTLVEQKEAEARRPNGHATGSGDGL